MASVCVWRFVRWWWGGGSGAGSWKGEVRAKEEADTERRRGGLQKEARALRRSQHSDHHIYAGSRRVEVLIMRSNTMCRSEESRYDFKNVHLRGPFAEIHAEISLRGNFAGRGRERGRVRRIWGNHRRVVKSPLDRPQVTKSMERFFPLSERPAREGERDSREAPPKLFSQPSRQWLQEEEVMRWRGRARCHLPRQQGDDWEGSETGMREESLLYKDEGAWRRRRR